MKDVVEEIRSIEQRARAVRALRAAGLSFSLSIVPILVFFLLERMHVAGLAGSVGLVLAGFSVVVLVSSFLIVRRMPIDTAKILLRVDMALESEECFSSFYEMYQHHQSGPYREMLESRLREGRLSWHGALPFGRTALLIPVGVALLAGVLITSSLFPVSHEIPAPAVSGVIATSTRRTTSSIETEGQRGMNVMGNQGSTSAPGMSSAQPKHDLQDVLGTLWGNPSAPGVVSSDQQDLDQLIAQQRQAERKLVGLISQIEKRLAEGDGGLTFEERNAISRLAQQIGSEPLRQALRGLATEKDPEELQKRLEQTQRLIGALQEPSGSSLPQAMKSEPPDSSNRSNDEGSAYSAPMAANPDEENHEPTGGGAPSASSTMYGGKGDQLQGGDEPFGGESGGNAGAQPTSASPQFTRREIAGSIGSAGDFKEFVTKGVPVEQAPSTDGESPSLSVNYDQLRALLSARTLPAGVNDVVRRYFDDITQGGE